MNDQWAGPSPDDLAQPEDSGLADRLIREEFARAPADSVPTAGAHLHQEFAEERAEGGTVPLPAPPPHSRSHRAGTLAGLGVVGALLAVLVVVAPGGSAPKQAPQRMHDSPVARTAASNLTSTVAPLPIRSTATTTTTTRPGATASATLHCILGLIC
jgi:hypothetical protein